MRGLRRPSGFTAIELAIVLTIILILVPIVFTAHRQFQFRLDTNRARVELAGQMRELTRVIRSDRWKGRWVSAESLELKLPCGQVTYLLDGSKLLRQVPPACGASRIVAREIESITRKGSLIEVRLVRAVSPEQSTTVALNMGVRP